MAKLVIKGHTPHPMTHVPEIPCYHVTVELHGTRIITTNVQISFEDAHWDGKSSWEYGHSVNPEFDEIDANWGYKASEEVLRYAERAINSCDSFKNWQSATSVHDGGDCDSTGPDESVGD